MVISKGLGKWKQKFWGFGFPFSSALVFWRDFKFCPQKKFKLKIQNALSRASDLFLVWCLSRVLGVHPRLRLGHFRYGYSRLDAYERKIRTAQIPGNEPFSISALLGERKFPLPGSGSPRLRGVCPRHPHTTLCNISFIEYDFRLRFPISIQLRRSSFSHGHHSGKCPRRNTRACPSSRDYARAYPPVRAREAHSLELKLNF